MAYYQLDRPGEANTTFKELQRTVREPKWSQDREAQRFLREAAALVGEAAPSDEDTDQSGTSGEKPGQPDMPPASP